MTRKRKPTASTREATELFHAASPALAPRHLRLAEEIRRVLAEAFARNAFRNPELASISLTLTEVRVTSDLRHATAYVRRLGLNDDAQTWLPALKNATPFLRTKLARSLRIRVVPELHFESDDILERASKIDVLLRSPEVSRDLKSDN